MKLICPVESVLPMKVTGEGSLPAHIPFHESFLVSPLPCPAEEGSDAAALVAPGSNPAPSLQDQPTTMIYVLIPIKELWSYGCYLFFQSIGQIFDQLYYIPNSSEVI